jgi:hypothetical protein
MRYYKPGEVMGVYGRMTGSQQLFGNDATNREAV